MRILGYGEDALTYWALSRHLSEVISEANPDDDSPADKALLIYRPSFGRGGNAGPQFGEFDAIVATQKAVYLIESKWTDEQIFNGGQVRLKENQIRRHEVFRWVRERWLEQEPANWTEFYKHNGNVADFAARFQGKPLVKPGRRLASNLQYVLQQLPSRNVPTRDVLLYFHLEGARNIPRGVEGALDFVVVPFQFHPLNPEDSGRIINMKAR